MENTGNLLVALSANTLYFLLIWSWQAALLLSAVWFTLKLDRSRTAVVRHRIWVLGLIGVATLPLGAAVGDLVPLPRSGPLNYVAEIPAAITSAISPLRSTSGRAPVEPAVDNGEPAADRQRSVRWASVVRSMLFLAWIAGSMTALCRFCVFSWKLRRVCGKARRVSVAELDCDGLDRRSP